MVEDGWGGEKRGAARFVSRQDLFELLDEVALLKKSSLDP